MALLISNFLVDTNSDTDILLIQGNEKILCMTNDV